MNKYLYFLGLAGAAFLSACSNSDVLSIGGSSSDDKAKESVLIYEAGQNSEVPITLGISQSRGYTRKPIEGESNNPTYVSFDTEPGKYLGVFCLATGYQEPYNVEGKYPIANTWSADDETGLNVRMKNVPTTVTGGAVAFLNHARTGEQSYYYPMSNWMKYNFYTYYPWQDETVDSRTLVLTDTLVYEKFYTIDGSQDVIWGKSDPSDDKYDDAPDGAEPFSASYFRWKKTDIAEHGGDITNYTPQFSFDHKLVQFRFFVKAASPEASAKNIVVKDMNISNGINRLQLVVADKNHPENNGKLYWFGNSIKTEKMGIKKNGSDIKRFDQESPFVVNADDDANLDNPLSITDADVDVEHNDPIGYIMLAPPTVRGIQKPNIPNALVYELVVKVRYEDGGTINDDLHFELNPPSDGFLEGKIYNIVINIDV